RAPLSPNIRFAGPFESRAQSGSATSDSIIRVSGNAYLWARSGAHRANMLRRDVTSYGLGSADSANGKRYWVLEVGN
ncbi:MAG: CAP domain-containing protein, partial [Pseudolabrys sp.]